MSPPPHVDDRAGALPVDGGRITVLAIVGDEPTRALLPKVLANERLIVAADLVKGLAFAQAESPDVVFVDITIGNGAGLAIVHHMKATAPETQVYAIATKAALEAGAHAVALGGAGLLMMPLGGDEVLNAVTTVKARRAERAVRLELEQQILTSARATGWVARMAELSTASGRAEAAQRVAEVLMEATGATGAAMYLPTGDRPGELTRAAVTPTVEQTPASGTEAQILEHARAERMLDISLALRSATGGHVLLANPEYAGSLSPPLSSGADSVPSSASPANAVPISSVRRSALRDGLLKLLATQASASLALLGERERLRGAAVLKDATSSAYSFAYYADVAARELYRASRYGRRLAFAVFLLDRRPGEVERAGAPREFVLSPARVVDYLQRAAPEPTIIARVDENELHVLLPDADGIMAHAYRRRALADLTAGSGEPDRAALRGITAGTATFPHDGEDLTRLLGTARRRAEASRVSIAAELGPDQGGIADLLTALEGAAASSASSLPFAPRALELPLDEAASLASLAVVEAQRGGAAFIAVSYRAGPGLFAIVRASLGPSRQGVTFRSLDVRAAEGCKDIDVLCILAEQGTYALLGRIQQGVLRGVHTAEPRIADILVDRLGRAAGLRTFP